MAQKEWCDEHDLIAQYGKLSFLFSLRILHLLIALGCDYLVCSDNERI
jgi:hypothetical protein